MKLEDIKKIALVESKRLFNRLVELSTYIHNNPELGFKEIKASEAISQLLKEEGMQVEQAIDELPTSLKAYWMQESNKPCIAFLAEYDALPDIGHGCGHNLISMCSIGALLATKKAMEESNLKGKIVLYGCPAEEGAVKGAGGKVYLFDKGLFDNVDACLMAHPSNKNSAQSGVITSGRVSLEIIFYGKASHAASSPDKGINALEAAILCFNSWNSLKSQLKEGSSIHGIITEGGKAPNIVPDISKIHVYLRSTDSLYLKEIEEKVMNCARGAALAIGAKVEFRYKAKTYEPLLANRFLVDLFTSNIRALGVNWKEEKNNSSMKGSTDAGNISKSVPVIHPYFCICPSNIATHSKEFTNVTATEDAHKITLKISQALSLTALDLLYNPKLINDMKLS